MDRAMIKAEAVKKSFGRVRAVDGLDLQVEAGSVLGLLGPNGSGKTTTVRMLTTLLPMDAGRASVAGFDVRTQPDLVRQSVGLTGQYASVDDNLTGRENIEMFAQLYHLPRREAAARASTLLERFRLTEFADRPTKTYSGGQRRRLDVAASLVANPPVLFLDEPTAGLDPHSRNDLWSAVSELASLGTTVLLTTQYLEEADRLADQIVVIDNGRVAASGTPDQLKNALGRSVLQITVESEEGFAQAASLLGRVSPEVVEDREGLMLQIALGDGKRSSLDTLRLLDNADIALTGFELRRPTLDEVFLAITEGPKTEQGRQANR
jgi:ABC-2 type transport system ATP-binding protein